MYSSPERKRRRRLKGAKMELNREQIVKALTMFVEDMPANLHLGFTRTTMFSALLNDTIALIRELTEENERLRGILLQFTDIVHKWGNKNGYDTSEIALVPILNEATAIKSQIKADTVRKMQERLKEGLEHYPQRCGDCFKEKVDQIAKEMLEATDEV